MKNKRNKDRINADIPTIVGGNIRKFREARGLTREQLAEAVDLDTGYLGMCERGERQLGLNKTLEIIKYFGLAPNDILPIATAANEEGKKALICEINALLENAPNNKLLAIKCIIETIDDM